MSEKKEQKSENTKNIPEDELDQEEIERQLPKILKKRTRKAKIVSQKDEFFDDEDDEKLLFEISSLLKKARVAIAEEKYIDAIKCYQDAAITASMIGDTEREKIYLIRANEILQEHPELKAEGVTILKKRKNKAKIREKEEKFSIIQLISNLLVAVFLLILVYSGLISAIILQEIFEMSGSYNVTQLWGICILIEITGVILAYFIGKSWLRWPE
ncbi:MAG: hypothetical protein ACFFD2_13800 [Promethearchaeota archaeon]